VAGPFSEPYTRHWATLFSVHRCVRQNTTTSEVCDLGRRSEPNSSALSHTTQSSGNLKVGTHDILKFILCTSKRLLGLAISLWTCSHWENTLMPFFVVKHNIDVHAHTKILVDNLARCCEKSNIKFEKKLNIAWRKWHKCDSSVYVSKFKNSAYIYNKKKEKIL
jgi:hypothetical protein